MDSSLPQLKPKKTSKSALSTSNTSPTKPDDGEISPASIKKEVNQLYPRLQIVEKEVNTMKQQLPSNINKVIIQLRSDIEKLGKIQEDEELPENPKSELQIKIDELEAKLQKELDQEIKKANKNLEKRISELTKPRPENDPNSLKLDFNTEITYDERVDNIEELFKSQQQKIQSRISSIEQLLLKFNEASNKVNTDENSQVKTINDELDENRRKIADLRTRVSNMKIQLEQQVAKNQGTSLDESLNMQNSSGAVSQLLATIDIPDISHPLEELHANIITKQNEFNDRVKELKQRAENCSARMKRVDQKAVDIVTATATLESRLTEVDKICKNLASAISDLEITSTSQNNQKLIHDLTIKVMDDHNKLKNEIEAVKRKAIQCQESVRSAASDKGIDLPSPRTVLAQITAEFEEQPNKKKPAKRKLKRRQEEENKE